MDPNLVEVLKVLIPALGAWLLAWLTNRKERREWEAKQESEHRNIFQSQSDKLTAGWDAMTTQAREIISRLQMETIDAKTRASVAEENMSKLQTRTAVAEEAVVRLQRELAEVRERYNRAIEEIEDLKEKSKRPARSRERDQDQKT